MQTETMLDEIERTSQLDAPADFLLGKVGKSLAEGPFGDLLKGKWLGHPLHPVLTDIPIGFWTSGMVLDFLAPKAGRKAAQRLIGLGTLSAIPAALAGLTDASSIEDPAERRVAAARRDRQRNRDVDVRAVVARTPQGSPRKRRPLEPHGRHRRHWRRAPRRQPRVPDTPKTS